MRVNFKGLRSNFGRYVKHLAGLDMHDLRKQLLLIQTDLPLQEVERRIELLRGDNHFRRATEEGWSPQSHTPFPAEERKAVRGLYGAMSSIIIINRILARKLPSLNNEDHWYSHIPFDVWAEAIRELWWFSEGDEEAEFE